MCNTMMFWDARVVSYYCVLTWLTPGSKARQPGNLVGRTYPTNKKQSEVQATIHLWSPGLLALSSFLVVIDLVELHWVTLVFQMRTQTPCSLRGINDAKPGSFDDPCKAPTMSCMCQTKLEAPYMAMATNSSFAIHANIEAIQPLETILAEMDGKYLNLCT